MNRLLIFVLLIILFFGCVKQAEKRIEGTWHFYYLEAGDTGLVQLWTFSEPDVLIRVIKNNDSLFYDTAKWEIDKDFLEPKFLKVSGLDNLFDGTYQILKLNKKYLFLQRTQLPGGASKGAFRRLEFAKE